MSGRVDPTPDGIRRAEVWLYMFGADVVCIPMAEALASYAAPIEQALHEAEDALATSPDHLVAAAPPPPCTHEGRIVSARWSADGRCPVCEGADAVERLVTRCLREGRRADTLHAALALLVECLDEMAGPLDVCLSMSRAQGMPDAGLMWEEAMAEARAALAAAKEETE